MTSERWNYIKNLRPSGGRYVHISAPIREIKSTNPETGVVSVRRVVQKPGITFRNPTTRA